ncbi:hypothetical protein [Gulosibacter sp. 10]|uniref:hypothetical protein n=1 Tax=Gulosibacter sp. 10 TaxID=1255570 RepID=UPI00097E94C7|nr:hypothetical protein [Gulosibacter sp. 10]SJM56998.1 hypothetical protein FM112_04995 [Gulosibacter sp. 10]
MRFPQSAVEWALEVEDRGQARAPGLVDAIAAGAYPALLGRLGREGDAVLALRERARVGLLRRIVEYTAMAAAVAGVAALFSGRHLRFDYDWDARTALPISATGLGLAALGLLIALLLWVRPSRQRSLEGMIAAAVATLSGIGAALLIPGKAADWQMSGWEPYAAVAWGAAALGALSFAAQLVWGVGSADAPPGVPHREALERQWALLPERARARILADREEALHVLADRGMISREEARRRAGSEFGAGTAPLDPR